MRLVRQLSVVWLAKPETPDQRQGVGEDSKCAGRVCKASSRAGSGHDVCELRREQDSRRTDHASSDVNRKTLHPRQVVAPEAKRAVQQKTGEKDPALEQNQAMRRSIEVNAGEDYQSGDQEATQKPPLRCDPNHKKSKKQAAGNRTDLLKQLHT
jgi:hypothetical protein